MTDPTIPTPPTAAPYPPDFSPPAPKRVVQLGIPALIIAAVAVLVLGFVGGVVSHAVFPAQKGATGAAGKQGQVGQTGPTGPAGNAANINLSNIGYCINFQYQYGGTVSYISSADISPPVLTNGTQSCPNGTFTPLQPTTPPG
jgi:hypothetical protein